MDKRARMFNPDQPDSDDVVVELNKLLDLYLEERLLRPDTTETYRKTVKRWLAETGISRVDQISRHDVIQWRSGILSRARPETWNKYRRHMRPLLNYALAFGWARSNPFAEVPPASTSQGAIKTCDTQLIDRALSLLLTGSAHGTVEPGWFWALVLRGLFYTGVRRRQFVGLRWCDVDLNRQTWRLSAETSKTRREWTIPIPVDLAEDLGFLWERAFEAMGHAPRPYDQVYNVTLFYHRYRGRLLTGNQLGGFFARLSNLLGERMSAHRLRHTLATLLGPGGDIGSLKNILGHTNISTTMRYIHPDVEDMRRLQSHLPSLRGPARRSAT